MRYQKIENSTVRSFKKLFSDGELVLIPWPKDMSSAIVAISANSTSIGGLVLARTGSSPTTVPVSALADLVVTSSDISVLPPAAGTGKVTIGRTVDGLQIHAGGKNTISVAFLG